MDTAIRTLRLETSKKGRPNTPCHPSSAGSSQKDLEAPIPKELGPPSLEGGMLGSENRKQESKMAVAKEQGREKPVKIEQRRGPQAEQTALLASPIYIGRPGGGKNIKRGAKGPGVSLSLSPACVHSLSLCLSLSVLCAPALPHSLLFASLGQHALMPRGWILLLFSK